MKWAGASSVIAARPMLKTLIDPVAGVQKAVEGRRWVLPMIVVCASVSFSGLAVAWRLDASAAVAHAKLLTTDLGHGRLDVYQAIAAWRAALGMK